MKKFISGINYAVIENDGVAENIVCSCFSGSLCTTWLDKKKNPKCRKYKITAEELEEPGFDEAIDRAFKKLMKMPVRQLRKKLKEHENGEIARILRHGNFILDIKNKKFKKEE